MQIVASNGPLGSKVTRNAVELAANLAQGAGSMQISADIFSINDEVQLEAELVRIDSTGTTPNITRNLESSGDDDHDAGAWVLARAGEAILDHTFDGSETTQWIMVSSERKFWWALEVDGVRTAPRSVLSENPVVLIPYTKHQPAVSQNVKIYVWCTVTVMFQVDLI